MRNYRENAQLKSIVLSRACCGLAVPLLAVLLLIFWPAAPAMAQSDSAPAAQSQAPAQSQSDTASQSGSQSGTALQTVPGDEQESLANAARKATAQKDKPKSKHVFTDSDISSVGGTISVVGDGSSGGGSADNRNSSAGPHGNGAPSSGGKDEAYWRGRAQDIKNQMAAIDQQIAKVKEDIAKSGAVQMDPSSGAMQSVIIIHDRNAEVKDLEDRKQGLEKQLDELADEGRKAGADSGWFR